MSGLLMSPWPEQNRPQTQGGLPDVGPLYGLLSLLPQLAPKVPQGAPRPFAPGEMIKNPDGTWSSEVSITVPHPSQKGKWTNLPSVWLVDGMPRRLSDDDAMIAALKSALNWPVYGSAKEADSAAAKREENWQTDNNPRAVPPLWNR